MEEYIDIDGYDGVYKISNLGNVKSIKRNVSGLNTSSDKILRQSVSLNGYSFVVLSKSSKIKTIAIHRLMAIAFIPNPENKKCVNHKNGIKLDNRLENLEWMTHSENNTHAYATGLKVATWHGNQYQKK